MGPLSRPVGIRSSRSRFMLGMYQAAHEGFFAGVDPLLGDLLGREPQTVHDLLATPAA
jgi:NAD(P)H dehydrogenase (quinone)